MIALARVIGTSWHAVERDLLSLGYHADDIGSKLTLWELISIVIASQPGTSVHHWTGGWSREAEMLANLGEQRAGLIGLTSRYERPGVDPTQFKPVTEFDRLKPYDGIALDASPVDEFTVKLKERQKAVREGIDK